MDAMAGVGGSGLGWECTRGQRFASVARYFKKTAIHEGWGVLGFRI